MGDCTLACLGCWRGTTSEGGERRGHRLHLEACAPLYDPFCGSGSIPFEAQRLGFNAFGSDLNPVAVLISKGLTELPFRFKNAPINPEARNDNQLIRRSWIGGEALAKDVQWYGRQLTERAYTKLKEFYPNALLGDGKTAKIVAWLWTRTVRSPDPAARGAMVPLVSTWMLSTKPQRKAWVEPILDPRSADGYRFEVKSGPISEEDEKFKSLGTKAAQATFRCLLTGAVISGEYVDAEAQAGRLKSRLLAVVAEAGRSRVFLTQRRISL